MLRIIKYTNRKLNIASSYLKMNELYLTPYHTVSLNVSVTKRFHKLEIAAFFANGFYDL